MAKKPKFISVFEYQSVTYKEKKRHYKSGFTKDIYEAFLSFHDKNPQTPFFELIHDGVRFKNYVGAIQVSGVTIEVLPKAGKQGNTAAWQNVLISMLKTCNLLQAKQSGTANLKLRANSVLELYFEMFLNEVESLLHKGLIKKYRKRKGQQRSLKGALLFNEHVSKNVIHKERFFVSYTTYTKNHLLHQIINEALFVINSITFNSVIKDKIGRIKAQFPEVNRINIDASIFNRITENRKHQSYERAISIAKLILLNYRPDIKAGRKDLLAIMFDMNILWEEYIFRLLKKTQSKDFEILAQRKKLFWGESQKIKPDIVLISKETNETFIIDTKWKVVSKNRPSDDDLKQMYVYNHHWSSRRSVLLYPNAGNQKSTSGLFALNLKEDMSHSCQLAFVNVINNSGLNENLASEIFSLLEDQE